MDRRLSAGHEIGFDLVAVQPQDFYAASVVATVPLDIDVAGFIGALGECRGVFAAVIRGDLADRTQARRSTGIFQEDGAATRGHDDRLADEADVAGANKVIAPGDAVLAVLEPV